MRLQELDSLSALIKLKETAIPGAIEVQQLRHSFPSAAVKANVEAINANKPAGWNHTNHHMVVGSKPGDWISYTLTEQFKKSTIALQFTRDASYGTVKVNVNGKQQGGLINLGDTKSKQPYLVELGTHSPVNNQFVIKIQFSEAGKRKNTELKAGIDYVKITGAE